MIIEVFTSTFACNWRTRPERLFRILLHMQTAGALGRLLSRRRRNSSTFTMFATNGSTKYAWRRLRRGKKQIGFLSVWMDKCPPEDSGGTFGKCESKQTLSDPASSKHDSMRKRTGVDLDPETSYIDAVNQRLSGEFEIGRSCGIVLVNWQHGASSRRRLQMEKNFAIARLSSLNLRVQIQ